MTAITAKNNPIPTGEMTGRYSEQCDCNAQRQGASLSLSLSSNRQSTLINNTRTRALIYSFFCIHAREARIFLS